MFESFVESGASCLRDVVMPTCTVCDYAYEGKTSPIQAIAKRSDEQYYTELVYRNDTWVKTGTTWTYNPITTPYSSYGKRLVIPSIIPMKAWMEDGVKRGMSTLYSMVGMTPEELTEENKQKIKHGILASFDDNVLFGLLKWTDLLDRRSS